MTRRSVVDIGRVNYEAYARHTGFKSLKTGEDLPTWEDLNVEIRDAWTIAAYAVAAVDYD
jgi:hypothetical protein